MEIKVDEADKVQPKDGDCDGVWVRLKGKKHYLVPAINFKTLRAMKERMATMGNIQPGALPDDTQMSLIIELAHSALVRNYPEMKESEVEEMIDMSNFFELFDALINVSGMKAKAAGEATAAR